jgi:hypothetical protein
MDERAIRSKIVQKLHSGLLAHDLGLPTMGGSGERGETCAACDQPISPSERLSVGYEGLARTRYWFHVRCEAIWQEERRRAAPPP